MNAQSAYLAGIVDGEGTITIHRHKQHNRDTYQLRPRLTVANTHRGLLDELMRRHGGTVISQPRRAANRTPSFIWRVCGTDDILMVVEAIRPYLIVKAEQADLMISYLRSRLTVRIAARRSGPYSEADMATYVAIREMNSREVKLCA